MSMTDSESRRLQGLPTPSFGLFGGLSADKIIGAWKDAIADDPSKDLVMGADGVSGRAYLVRCGAVRCGAVRCGVGTDRA